MCQEGCTVAALEAGSEVMIPLFQCAAGANCQDATGEEGGGPNPGGPARERAASNLPMNVTAMRCALRRATAARMCVTNVPL